MFTILRLNNTVCDHQLQLTKNCASVGRDKVSLNASVNWNSPLTTTSLALAPPSLEQCCTGIEPTRKARNSSLNAPRAQWKAQWLGVEPSAVEAPTAAAKPMQLHCLGLDIRESWTWHTRLQGLSSSGLLNTWANNWRRVWTWTQSLFASLNPITVAKLPKCFEANWLN
jgi:hypothetical protein